MYTRATAACSLLVLSLDTYYVLLLSPLSQTHPILGHTYLVLANLGGHTFLVLAKLGGGTEHRTRNGTGHSLIYVYSQECIVDRVEN